MSLYWQLYKTSKKLVLVSVDFVLMTDGDEENMLRKISYIYYLLYFNKDKVWIIFNNRNKINAISFNYAQKFGLKIWITSVGAQKINKCALKIL